MLFYGKKIQNDQRTQPFLVAVFVAVKQFYNPYQLEHLKEFLNSLMNAIFKFDIIAFRLEKLRTVCLNVNNFWSIDSFEKACSNIPKWTAYKTFQYNCSSTMFVEHNF